MSEDRSRAIESLRNNLTQAMVDIGKLMTIVETMAEHDKAQSKSISSLRESLACQDAFISELKSKIDILAESTKGIEAEVDKIIQERKAEKELYIVDRRHIESENFNEKIKRSYPFIISGGLGVAATIIARALVEYFL